jgi:hypothetical protein
MRESDAFDSMIQCEAQAEQQLVTHRERLAIQFEDLEHPLLRARAMSFPGPRKPMIGDCAPPRTSSTFVCDWYTTRISRFPSSLGVTATILESGLGLHEIALKLEDDSKIRPASKVLGLALNDLL